MAVKPFKLSVRAFIKYTGSLEKYKAKYLLVQRAQSSKNFKGLWEAPGGKLDNAEAIDQALVREISEETGLSVVLDGVAGANEFEMPEIRIVTLFINAHTDCEKVQLSDEHKDFKWLLPAEFQTLELAPALKKFLKNPKDGIL
jgi:8-oxo-dGTP pyrophosphatase MutT (NUDIX family)